VLPYTQNTIFFSVRHDTISSVDKGAVRKRLETLGLEWFMGQEAMRISGLDRLKIES
jgi:hypothetical protein